MSISRQRYEREMNALYVDLIAAADESGGAPCTANPDLMFPEDQEETIQRRIAEIKAKAVCAKCAVVQQCREYAVLSDQRYGVWGMQTADERFSP